MSDIYCSQLCDRSRHWTGDVQKPWLLLCPAYRWWPGTVRLRNGWPNISRFPEPAGTLTASESRPSPSALCGTAFEAAKKAIGREAARILIWVYEDWPLRSIQWRLRIGCHRTAARRIAEHAGALADHYAEIDERSGRSATPYTTAAAIKLVDPDDPEP